MSDSEARVFELKTRVPYAHTDQMGFVYYANYLIYFEMARMEMLLEAGMPYTEMEASGIMLPVVEAHCNYIKSAGYEDLLTIRTRCTELRGPRLRIEYEVSRDEELLATGHTDHVCMNSDGKAIRPTPAVKSLLS